jgi:peptidoglycan glycosyltransferase
MNRPIIRLFMLILVLYGVLLAFTSYWSVFDAKGLRDNVANRRPLLEQQRIRRGTIKAVDGTVVAFSRAQGRGSKRVYTRQYPTGTLYGNPIGYSYIDKGQVGTEKAHNDELVGNKNEFGSILDQLQGHSQEGDDLVTNLDTAAQKIASDQLAGRCGSVVALEPETGKVRTMVSIPDYDPNLVENDKVFQDFNKDPKSPLFNRATQSGYPPGSTFKVVTATAAIDSGEMTPSTVLNGASPKTIGGFPLKNFGGEQFGDIDMTTALTHSVNTYFAQVGEKIGKDTLYRYMNRYGFNRRPELDYPLDQLRASGVYSNGHILHSSDAVDVGRVAIGQERLAVTPLQMAEVVAAVANRGVLMRPRIWDRVVDPDGRTVKTMHPSKQSTVMKEETASTLTEMMTNVVREGTGTAAALSGIDVAGKTGTAEVGPNTCGSGNQAWFIGFAPADAPRVAVAVTVERTPGQGGSDAAPIAKSVMESLLN